jgi:uncharacterized protein (DUF433 family)/DNA-binding transcriptional MerR regulator
VEPHVNKILGNGIYTIPEAARLTSLNTARLREWFAQRDGKHPLLKSDYDTVKGDRAVSFLDLIDALIAGKLREKGISLQTIRTIYRKLEDDFNTAHPFCRKELLTDGQIVFVRSVNEMGQEQLIEILTRQQVFPKVILPYLKQIEYDPSSNIAVRWNRNHFVTIDPKICFGKPVIKTRGISTKILSAEYKANGNDARAVADWYEISPDEVLAAVKFEKELAA